MIDTNNITIALTDARIRDAIVPDGKSETFLKDLKQHGLTVRVRKSGARSFYFTHTRPGMKGSHKTFIGKFPALGVAAARKHAAMLAGERVKGIDLIEDRRKQKQDAIKARKQASGVVTLNALIGGDEDNCRYARARQREGIKNWAHELGLGYLRRSLLAGHRDTDIKKLSRRDVMVCVNRLKEADKHGAADGVYKHAFTFLGWAVDEGYCGVANRNASMWAEKAQWLTNAVTEQDRTVDGVAKAATDFFEQPGLHIKAGILQSVGRHDPAFVRSAPRHVGVNQ